MTNEKKFENQQFCNYVVEGREASKITQKPKKLHISPLIYTHIKIFTDIQDSCKPESQLIAFHLPAKSQKSQQKFTHSYQSTLCFYVCICPSLQSYLSCIRIERWWKSVGIMIKLLQSI